MLCSKCGIETTEFYPKNKVACKECVKARSYKWIREHRERYREIAKKNYRKSYRPKVFGPFLPRKEAQKRSFYRWRKRKQGERRRIKAEQFAGPPRPSFEWLFKEYWFGVLMILAGKAELRRKKRRLAEAAKKLKRRGVAGSHSLAEINGLYAQQDEKCAACRVDLNGVFDRDHIMPVCLGGSNYIENIQLLCRGCNNAKGGKHPKEWVAGKAVA